MPSGYGQTLVVPWHGVSSCDTAGTFDITYAREFRYDGARQRYLNRELDPAKLLSEEIVALSKTWSDYDGDEVYGDFTIDGQGAVTEQISYQPGIARTTDPLGAALTAYYHTDHLGSTRLMSDPTGSGSEAASYTAFGQPLSGPNHRYGYAGAWGYQAHDEFPFLHVGARYYGPPRGGFLQRDPIGVAGGLNVYTYVGNSPTIYTDPDGLRRVGRGPRVYGPGPRLPYNPRGMEYVTAPDTPAPDLSTVEGVHNAAENLLMMCTGGPVIPPPIPPKKDPTDTWYCSHCHDWFPQHESHFHRG